MAGEATGPLQTRHAKVRICFRSNPHFDHLKASPHSVIHIFSKGKGRVLLLHVRTKSPFAFEGVCASEPPDVPHSVKHITSRREGDAVRYICDPGYESNFYITCQSDKQWSQTSHCISKYMSIIDLL